LRYYSILATGETEDMLLLVDLDTLFAIWKDQQPVPVFAKRGTQTHTLQELTETEFKNQVVAPQMQVFTVRNFFLFAQDRKFKLPFTSIMETIEEASKDQYTCQQPIATLSEECRQQVLAALDAIEATNPFVMPDHPIVKWCLKVYTEQGTLYVLDTENPWAILRTKTGQIVPVPQEWFDQFLEGEIPPERPVCPQESLWWNTNEEE